MLTAFASGSRGNFYAVDDGTTVLALECGLSFRKMQALCGHQIARFAACLVSHEHMDHAKAVPDLLARGIVVYMSGGTAEALEISHPLLRILKPLQTVRIGSFSVKPFPIEHDAQEPFGFLIASRTLKRKLLFATDTQCIRYTFRGVQEMAVECNYTDDLLAVSDLPEVVKTRITKSHMGLETVKQFLGACDLSKTERIYLLHLSGHHGQGERFCREIRELTGIETVIAGRQARDT